MQEIMLKTRDPSESVMATDLRGLSKLKALGSGDNRAKAQALKAAAQQFEQLLNQYWMNAMRSSNDSLNPDSPLHSKYSSMFEDMLSQEQVGQLSKKSQGISKNSVTYLVAKQFSKALGDEGKALLQQLVSDGNRSTEFNQGYGRRDYSTSLDPASYEARFVKGLSQIYGDLPADSLQYFESQEDFVNKLMPYALKAVEGQGFNPLVLVAQAALETGWGQHVPANNNYYGIKADPSWQGDKQELSSPEFENGTFVKRQSAFRAYSGLLDSMKDYIDFIRNNPRYGNAATRSFDPDTYFDEIARAGYATDPDYSAKLKNISRKIAFMAYK